MTRSNNIHISTDDKRLLQSIVPVSRETLSLFQDYVDLLQEWQGKTNLVAKSTLGDVWRRHICDSAQCRVIFPDQKIWYDLGAGAGFPGLVLAILGRDEPEFNVTLVESNGTKSAFLRRVIRETGAAANVVNSRIESVPKHNTGDVVLTARALARLDRIFQLTEGWYAIGAVGGATGLYAKGRDYLLELEECRSLWDFDLVVHQSRVEENSVLLEISNLKSKSSKLAVGSGLES